MRRMILVGAVTFVAGVSIGAVGTHGAFEQQQPAPTQRVLLTVALPELGGKEMRLFITDFPPGSATVKHFHPGHFVGYLERGTFSLRPDGKAPRELRTGAAWEEKPNEVFVGANASAHDTARVIAVGIFDKGAPLAVRVP